MGTIRSLVFSDVEGSTALLEQAGDRYPRLLQMHREVVREEVQRVGGREHGTEGDSFFLSFDSPSAAIAASVAIQRQLDAIDWSEGLRIRIRIGIHVGEVIEEGEDVIGLAVHHAARIASCAHGGQIVVSHAARLMAVPLPEGATLESLGSHRLRDVGAIELFQVRAVGLMSEFPRLRTVDAVPGNLPSQPTSFVGRDVEVNELVELVRAHRLVTLTGVGGVGKTRLAIQVAAELVTEFIDGVWLVELAPVGDPASVPDAVATGLGITPQPGRSVTASVAETLAGRRVLVVFDNCEHVLDATADLIDAILASSSTVSVIATSREGLRVGAEHLWAVPSLGVRDGAGSAAVELFIERARAAVAGFSLDTDVDVEAVIEICRRLDGIALAIELAAARMVSMTPADVLARLNDRFRLLSGSRRGLERHQTLRQAVQWSYDLLTADEQAVLAACAVFAGGFDVVSVTAVCDRFDEYTMLDVLDSLVRKSLINTTRPGGRSRYGMLETIRQFAEDQHVTTDGLGALRDRHARHYAAQAAARWELWDGPGYDAATGWLQVEFENLRAGFRWAADQADLVTATAIAAHTTMLAFGLQQYEPVGWAEELLPAAVAANLTQLPRLYTAASFCTFLGRPEDAVGYAHAAVRLQDDPGYEPFTDGLAAYQEAQAHLYSWRIDRYLEICTGLAEQTGLAYVLGLCGMTVGLTGVGRSDDAIAIAADTMTAARAHANPFLIAYAYFGSGMAYTEKDPHRALDALREALAYTRQHSAPLFEALIARDAAGLEAAHGDIDQALDMFTVSIDSFHQSGDTTNLAVMFAHLMAFFDRAGRSEIAATFYGITTTNSFSGFATAVDHLRNILDTDTFDTCARSGAAMTTTESVYYARQRIDETRRQRT